MKKSTRLLAVLLTFLMLFSAIPLTAGAEDTPARTVSFESAAVGDVLDLTYSLTSELPVLNAQMKITYPESVTLTSTFDTEEAKQEAFPVISKDVVVHHDTEKRTVEFAVTNASTPYTFGEDNNVLCSLKFTVATAGNVEITYDIEYIGAEINDEKTPAGQAIVEKNVVNEESGATEKMEFSRESSGMDKAVINDKDAEINQYVYYEYTVTTDMALEDGEIKITYPKDILELVEQDNELRFPTLQGYPSLKLETKDDEAGVFTVNFTDVDENDVIDGFDNGKVLVILAFKVIGNGKGEIKAETIALDGRNPNGVEEDGIPIDEEKIKDSVTVTDKLREVFKVTFPTVEGLTFTGASVVLEGMDYTFTITAAEGYDTSKMVVKNGNDTLTGKDGVYTIQAVKANVNITVTGVTKKSLKVTLPTGTGFTVKGEETVEYGENYTFTIEIEEGYTDKDMTVTATVDGKDVEVKKGTDGKYTIENVTGDIVIKVEGVKKDSDTPTPPTPTGLLGDVDMSKDIGTNDVTLVLQYIAGIVHEGDEGYDHSVSDVTGDGATDTLDATAILQYIAEIITKFPADK